MDTNLSLALKMAAGVLIALVIISAITLLFNNINPSQQQLEDIKALEQTADFNKEYEVYNKSLMYGVDVISLINKAFSNNKSYIEAYGYSDDLEENYLIDVEFESPISLTQTLDIKKIEIEDGKYREREQENFNILRTTNLVSDPTKTHEEVIYSKLNLRREDYPNLDVVTGNRNNAINGHLIEEQHGNEPYQKWCVDQNMYNYIIVESAIDLKRTAKNTEHGTSDIWSTAILETYAYDFKSKKFRCTDVGYSDITGRINYLRVQLIQ